MAAGMTFEESVKEYAKIFGALLLLTGLTVTVALAPIFDFGFFLNVAIGVAIAVVKASLVVWIFMHIKFDNPYLRTLIVVPLFLFGVMIFALALLENFGTL